MKNGTTPGILKLENHDQDKKIDGNLMDLNTPDAGHTKLQGFQDEITEELQNKLVKDSAFNLTWRIHPKPKDFV